MKNNNISGNSCEIPAFMQVFLDRVKNQNILLNSVHVLLHGSTLAELYWEPYGRNIPHAIHSVTKGLVSMAAGFLIADGLLDPEDRVIEYFPDCRNRVKSECWDTLKIRHLLTMTSGLARNDPFLKSHDYMDAFFEADFAHEPGTAFLYDNRLPYTLCEILKKQTGEDLDTYLFKKIFRKMNVNFSCGKSPTGISHGSSLGFLTTPDMAKIGQLYLNRGYWNGEALLPAEWVDESVTARVQTGGRILSECSGYGYYIWRTGRGREFLFFGISGQLIMVEPELDAVVTVTGSHTDVDMIIRAVHETLLPELAGADENSIQKKSFTEKLSIPLTEEGSGYSAGASDALSGKKYILRDNRESFLPKWIMDNRTWPKKAEAFRGLQEFMFIRTAEGIELDFSEKSEFPEKTEKYFNRWKLKAGEGSRQSYLSYIGEFDVMIWYRPDTEGRLCLDIRFLNYPHHSTVRFDFQGSSASITLTELPYADKTGRITVRKLEAVADNNS